MSALAITRLNQAYGGSRTLWDVDLAVAAGSRTCLMGRNGMGKTTLLKCIMGLLPATADEMRFGDSSLLGRPVEIRARLGIGYVPQGRDIFSRLTLRFARRVASDFRLLEKGRCAAAGSIDELTDELVREHLNV